MIRVKNILKNNDIPQSSTSEPSHEEIPEIAEPDEGL